MDRHTDNHHTGIGKQRVCLRPVFLLKDFDLITRQFQQTGK